MWSKIQSLEERFWKKVNVRGDDECWIWVGHRDQKGYGRIRTDPHSVGRGHIHAHRAAWELTNGPIPDGFCVCHHCDNPPCVNPKHLFLGTKKDNTQDSIAKDRFTIGERNGMAKLTQKQVDQIRVLLSCGATQREVASWYGVSEANISLIKVGARWKRRHP